MSLGTNVTAPIPSKTVTETVEAMKQATQAAPATVKEASPKSAKAQSKTDEFIKNISKEQLKKLANMTEEDFIKDASMEAIPYELPEMLSVKLVDTIYVARWVNWKAGGGANYGKMKAMGFVPCTEEDVVPGCLDPDVFKPGNVGRYEYYDVVLMKIHKLQYFSRLKMNHIRTLSASRDGIHKLAKESADKELSNSGLRQMAGKVNTFVPGEEDANALMGKD